MSIAAKDEENTMKIAVTAVSGHLGAEIVKATVQLVGEDNVVGLARTPSKAVHLGVEIRRD
jgi:NAD(P)H dehydrogenase (quinone)